MKFIENLNRTVKRMQLKGKKYSPEILAVVGAVGVVTSAVLACKATLKVTEITDDAKGKIEQIKEAAENSETLPEPYSAEDAKHDLTIVYTQTAVKMVKNYAMPVTLGVLSLGALLSSNHILRKRNAALAAAYTAVDTAFKKYRSNVVDRFGEQVDKELRYSVKKEEVTDENGNKKTILKPTDTGKWSKFFDEYSPYWEKDAEYNLMFLRNQQSLANAKLKANGYLFLNDVYEMLGLDKTKAGQVIGWIYDEKFPMGDNYVDFGIYDGTDERKIAFVNGYERSILLDFNCDGNIYEMMA